jgi:hypothetical protein
MPSSREKRLMLQDMEIELLQAELRLLYLKRERAKIRANETRKGELQQRTYDRPTTVTKKSGEPDYTKFHRSTSVNVFANQSGRPDKANMFQSGWPDNTKLCEQGRPVTMRSSMAVTEQTLFDQCVVSDGGEDGTPKTKPKADISSVELGRTERDQ